MSGKRVIVVVLLLLAPPLRAQTTQPVATTAAGDLAPRVRIVRAKISPKIDGELDDPAWQDAAVITELTQADPHPGAAPTERTEVRLLYDQDYLYIAFRCFDSQPDQIIAKQMQRDGSQDSDDAVGVCIDTFHDKRNGYQFQVGAAGAKRDGSVDTGGTTRIEWDGIWYAKTSIDDKGWVAEIAIPFKSISFDGRPGAVWGLNLQRIIRRRQETDRWASASQNSFLTNVGEAGTLEGIEGARQGLGLTIKPYNSTKFDFDDGRFSMTPGFDAYYRVTPSVQALLTVNTDFAETEVDTRQVNLTRFPLFFPEKRAFFLEDAGIFSFAGLNFTPIPFFSRRIGIVNGVQKDILAGIKVTGREDDLSFGLLDVQMKRDDELGDKNLSVVRANVNVLQQSTVGVIATHGDPDSPNDNTLGGVDFNFRTSDAKGAHIFEAHAFAMGTHSTDESIGDDNAIGGSLISTTDVFAWDLYVKQIGPRFDPALGFVERTGVRTYDAFTRYRWRPTGYVRRIDVQADYSLVTELDNDIQSAFSDPLIEFENHAGDVLTFAVDLQREVLTDPFEIHDGITIPTGGYNFVRPWVSFFTTTARPISLYLFYRNGTFYDGDRQDYEASVEWRPTSRFFTSVDYVINDIHLAEGDFLVRILRLRGNVLFSPEVTWSNLIQYDNVSDSLGVNSRVRWEFEPGKEMFVVLNQGFDVDRGRFSTTTSELTVKVGLTFRF